MHIQWVRRSSGTLITAFHDEFHSILIVQLSILNVITLIKCLDYPNKMALSNIHLPWAHFIFLFLLFQVHYYMSNTIALDFTFAPLLGLNQPISIPHLEHRLVPRVSSIHQNQTRAFNDSILLPTTFVQVGVSKYIHGATLKIRTQNSEPHVHTLKFEPNWPKFVGDNWVWLSGILCTDYNQIYLIYSVHIAARYISRPMT